MELLMRRYKLRSIRNVYRACKVTYSHGKIKEACGANHPMSNPIFLLGQEGKTRVLRGYCGIQKFNKVIVPRVISKADAVPRRPYPYTARLGRRALATSMRHYQRSSHCRGRASERGLVLTCLKGW